MEAAGCFHIRDDGRLDRVHMARISERSGTQATLVELALGLLAMQTVHDYASARVNSAMNRDMAKEQMKVTSYQQCRTCHRQQGAGRKDSPSGKEDADGGNA